MRNWRGIFGKGLWEKLDAVQVFDHFHVIKLMNDKLDKIRRATYQRENDENGRRVIKGQRWILLCNGEDLDESGRQRLDAALLANEPLAKAYYLKEALRNQTLSTPHNEYSCFSSFDIFMTGFSARKSIN